MANRFSHCSASIFSTHRIYMSGGWQGKPPSWKEYRLALRFKYREHLDALKAKVASDATVWKQSASDITRSYGSIRFDVIVGKGPFGLWRYFGQTRVVTISFTYRAWGDFMSAALDERTDYMEYGW